MEKRITKKDANVKLSEWASEEVSDQSSNSSQSAIVEQDKDKNSNLPDWISEVEEETITPEEEARIKEEARLARYKKLSTPPNKVIKEMAIDISTDGLDPFKGRFIGASFYNDDHVDIISARDEKVALEKVWKYLNDHKIANLIGFCSNNFDLSFLIIRSIKHGVKITPIKQSTDLREVIFPNWDKPKGKLSDFKELLCFTKENYGYAKMHMSYTWTDKDLPELRYDLVDDARVTWELYKRLKETGVVK